MMSGPSRLQVSMSSPVLSRYEQVAYPGFVYPQTHPGRLAVIGALFGMNPAPPERSNVLELGCGDGGNLIPLAYELPESRFFGLDLSPAAVQRGQQLIAHVGLKNVTITTGDILQFPADAGHFDYIVAHGVYSWVPAEVRQELLAICQAHLAPQGIVYISYNAKPGGYVSNVARDIMRFHTRHFSEPDEQMKQSRALLKFFAEATADSDPYRRLLSYELEQSNLYGDEVFFHDSLAEINEMFYLADFVEAASEHDLQYLGEAEFSEMQDHIFPETVRRTLNQLPDRIVREQYLDFLKCRRFRQTLLCRADVQLREQPDFEVVQRCWIAGAIRPAAAAPNVRSDHLEYFEGPRKSRAASNHPISKAALVQLGDMWPQAAHFEDLYANACAAAGAARDESDRATLAQSLLGCYSAGLLQLQA